MLRRSRQNILFFVSLWLVSLVSGALTAHAYDGVHGKVGKVKKKRVFVVWPNSEIAVGERVFVLNKRENGVVAELIVTQVKKGDQDTKTRFSSKVARIPKSVRLNDLKNRTVITAKELRENSSELSEGDVAILLLGGEGDAEKADAEQTPTFSYSNPLALVTGRFSSRQAKELALLSGSSQSVSVKNSWLGLTTYLTESTGLNDLGFYFEYLFKSPVTIDYKAADSSANRKAEYKESGSRAGVVYRTTTSGKVPFSYGARINGMDSVTHSFKFDSSSGGGISNGEASAEVTGFGIVLEAATTLQDKLLLGIKFAPPISKSVKVGAEGQPSLTGTVSELDFQFHLGTVLTPKIGTNGVYAEITGAFQFNSRTYAGLDELAGAEYASGSSSNFLVAVALGYSNSSSK